MFPQMAFSGGLSLALVQGLNPLHVINFGFQVREIELPVRPHLTVISGASLEHTEQVNV